MSAVNSFTKATKPTPAWMRSRLEGIMGKDAYLLDRENADSIEKLYNLISRELAVNDGMWNVGLTSLALIGGYMAATSFIPPAADFVRSDFVQGILWQGFTVNALGHQLADIRLGNAIVGLAILGTMFGVVGSQKREGKMKSKIVHALHASMK